MSEIFTMATLIALLIAVGIILWERKRPSENSLLGLLTTTYGEKLRFAQKMEELSRDCEDLARQKAEVERKLARCFEHVAPRVKQGIEDSWPPE